MFFRAVFILVLISELIFSGNKVFEIDNSNKPNAFVVNVNKYVKLLNNKKLETFFNDTIYNNKIKDNAYEVMFNQVSESLGISGSFNTLISYPFSSKIIKTIGNAFNHAGVSALLVQAAFDFSRGDNQSLYTNLLKNSTYSAVGYYGSDLLQLSFVGVFAIDYALSKFESEAMSLREEKWKRVYDICYKKYAKKSPKEWYYIFSKYLSKTKDTKSLKNLIETLIFNNAWDGWSREHLAECMDEAGYTGFGALGGELRKEEKRKIVLEKRKELINSLQPVFDRLAKDIRLKLLNKYSKNLNSLKDLLNSKITIKFYDSSANKKELKYANSHFYFFDNNRKIESFKGSLNENSEGEFTFTLLGYLQNNTPNKIYLYNSNEKLILKRIQLPKISKNIVEIDLNDKDENKSNEHSWKCPMHFKGAQQLFYSYDHKKLYKNLDYLNDERKNHSKNYVICRYYDNSSLSTAMYTFNQKPALQQEWFMETKEYPHQHLKYQADFIKRTFIEYERDSDEQGNPIIKVRKKGKI